MKSLATVTRQFNPPGVQQLPPLRLFRVILPDRPDAIVEASGVGTEGESAVLKFTEMVYSKDMNGEWVMLQYTRRMFRVWLDVEEIIGLSQVNTMVVQ